MFHPMALTVVIALAGAMLLSITFIPAAIALFMGDKVAEKENRLMGWARRGYAPVLARVMAAPAVVLTAAAVAVALSLLLATRLGSEFAPNLNEGTSPSRRCASPAPASRSRCKCRCRSRRRSRRSSRDRPRVRAHRHGRDRLRPHAAQHLRRLHHAESPQRVARPGAPAR